MISLLLTPNNEQQTGRNGGDVFPNKNDASVYFIKRKDTRGIKNFLNFIFRKFTDADSNLDTRNKRMQQPNIGRLPILMETYVHQNFE